MSFRACEAAKTYWTVHLITAQNVPDNIGREKYKTQSSGQEEDTYDDRCAVGKILSEIW